MLGCHKARTEWSKQDAYAGYPPSFPSSAGFSKGSLDVVDAARRTSHNRLYFKVFCVFTARSTHPHRPSSARPSNQTGQTGALPFSSGTNLGKCTLVGLETSTKVWLLVQRCDTCPPASALRPTPCVPIESRPIRAAPEPRGECRWRAVMRPLSGGPHSPARNRMTTCIWCHAPVLITAARRHEGICPLCVSENSEIAWRTVYDRERGVGQIPPNLRRDYQL